MDFILHKYITIRNIKFDMMSQGMCIAKTLFINEIQINYITAYYYLIHTIRTLLFFKKYSGLSSGGFL